MSQDQINKTRALQRIKDIKELANISTLYYNEVIEMGAQNTENIGLALVQLRKELENYETKEVQS